MEESGNKMVGDHSWVVQLSNTYIYKKNLKRLKRIMRDENQSKANVGENFSQAPS